MVYLMTMTNATLSETFFWSVKLITQYDNIVNENCTPTVYELFYTKYIHIYIFFFITSLHVLLKNVFNL